MTQITVQQSTGKNVSDKLLANTGLDITKCVRITTDEQHLMDFLLGL